MSHFLILRRTFTWPGDHSNTKLQANVRAFNLQMTGQEPMHHSLFSVLRGVALFNSSWSVQCSSQQVRLPECDADITWIPTSSRCQMYGLQDILINTLYCSPLTPYCCFHATLTWLNLCHAAHIDLYCVPLNSASKIQSGAAASTGKLPVTRSHDDSALVEDCLLELLVWKHNGSVQEHLILQHAQPHQQGSSEHNQAQSQHGAVTVRRRRSILDLISRQV